MGGCFLDAAQQYSQRLTMYLQLMSTGRDGVAGAASGAASRGLGDPDGRGRGGEHSLLRMFAEHGNPLHFMTEGETGEVEEEDGGGGAKGGGDGGAGAAAEGTEGAKQGGTQQL